MEAVVEDDGADEIEGFVDRQGTESIEESADTDVDDNGSENEDE